MKKTFVKNGAVKLIDENSKLISILLEDDWIVEGEEKAPAKRGRPKKKGLKHDDS